ncbi:MAG: hypothetical protein WC755_04915 [Candidatus Woesearchaeota archaeon]|jgi:hypothetical protein
MPGFDKNLDKEIFSDVKEFDRTRIKVSVFSYNGGQKKLQITRENKNASGEFSFTKLGRMSKDEVIAILPLIKKSTEEMG